MALDFFKPVSNISPFTYRDGETYLEQLSRLRAWIDEATTLSNEQKDDLIAQFDAGMATAIATAEAAADSAISAADSAISANAAVQGIVDNNEATLDAAIDLLALAGFNYRTDPGGDYIGARLDNKTGVTHLTVLGDSTGNDNNEWVTLTAAALANQYPDLHVERTLWSDATQSYPAPTVDQEGVQFTPPAPAGMQVTYDDKFERVDSGEEGIYGDTPNVGYAYEGSTNAIGVWFANGTKLVRSSKVLESPIAVNLGSGADMTMNLSNITLSTEPSAGNAEFAVIFKGNAASMEEYLRVRLTIVAGTGNVAYLIAKTDGTQTVLASGETNPIPANTASVTFNMSISTTGNIITINVNGSVLTHTLDGADSAQFSDNPYIGFFAEGESLTGMTIDRITVTQDLPVSGAKGYGLIVNNGSMPGATLDYHNSRLDEMVPPTTDVVIINCSHNYGDSVSVTEYLQIVENTVSAIKAQVPNARIIVTSQNPEFAGTFDVVKNAAHLDRLMGLRVRALENGWGYIPVVEAFRSRNDLGRYLVSSDGIHVTTNVDDPIDNGANVWRNVVLGYINAHSQIAG